MIEKICDDLGIDSKDLIISNLVKENQQLKDRIGKAITYIENQYYSKNTTNLENIWYTTNKLLKVREILKGVKDD